MPPTLDSADSPLHTRQPDAAGFAAALARIVHGSHRMYILITALLAALIAGFGASFAYFCRLPELDEVEGSD